MFQYQFQWLFTVLEDGSNPFGDHSMHGTDGLRFYTKLKTVTSRWPKSINKGQNLLCQLTK